MNNGSSLDELRAALFLLVVAAMVFHFLRLLRDKETRRTVKAILIVTGLLALSVKERAGGLGDFVDTVAGTFAIGGVFLGIFLPLAGVTCLIAFVAGRRRG